MRNLPIVMPFIPTTAQYDEEDLRRYVPKDKAIM
jgi:hypothetical protein